MMNCPGIEGLQQTRGRCVSHPMGQAPGSHWATTPLYFSASGFDAGMKRFCLGLIVLLVLVGAQALAA